MRYELMPYIYSYAGLCWLENGSMIRPLAFRYPKDKRVWDIMDQYLPEGNGWYDYRTGAYYEGGQWIDAEAGIEGIPVLVREGSIIPKGKASLSTEEQSREITLTVYGGKSGEFTLYEDAGDGYAYETGEFGITKFTWQIANTVLVRKDGVNVKIACEM